MQCILELFEAVISREPPYGLPHYPQSRAHYGVDIILKWDTDAQGINACLHCGNLLLTLYL